ncbi:uncharacterized protein LOC110624780 isoform X2 [Manihot esculenta]|uniref:V-SNARE coiled-coil homology domain-containing protein n=1 Tax=Manihot esculenta TaxID=3983 RepID=A0A2C9V296_MANES|nr:uncharacterized protein LOC110624780 isoform X2 [Manihot esculenta]OAY38396.1 hypothetical protein MANES_10G011200v8 [Manihot esculenta]
MLAKLFQKNNPQDPPSPKMVEGSVEKGVLRPQDINPRIDVHFGIPSTASILAFDPIQSLLAVGTLDGRIKVIGGDNIEGLLLSPKELPFKNLEFLQNQGFLVSITSENEIQVWDLEQRQLASTLKWESNLTALSVIGGSSYMYVGDEYGMVCVLKYDSEEGKLIQLPYYVPSDSIAEASGMSSPYNHSVVGLLPQPASQGKRILIAYDDGLITIWDVSEDKVILIKGNKDLQLKSKTLTDFQKGMGQELCDDVSEDEHMEKEISSLCWVSTDGTVLAVGYIDGDIMLWNLSTMASNNKTEKSSTDVVKLQLSSVDRRLPVIVLHWSADSSHNNSCGRIFVYGGDAIGSEEVLTILSIDWSSGIENLKCIGRIDLTLNGSFADLALLQNDGISKTRGAFILTNPGQLHFYDDACFASLMSQQQKQNSVSSLEYPAVIPVLEPCMTVGKLGFICRDEKFSKAFSKEAQTPRSTKWPLTGGIPSQPLNVENYQVERLYIAGYQDGSVRIWDATHPTFSLLYILGTGVKGINIAGANASVSALEFCPFTLSLAIGNELGMISLYKLMGSTDETHLYIVKETEREVHTLNKGDRPHCTAVFSFLNSPISTLQFANYGTRLAVGYHCGKVAMLDISALSVLFLTDSVSNSRSPVKSLAVTSMSDTISSKSNPEHIESKSNADYVKWELFATTKDAHFAIIDGNTGSLVCSQSLQPEKELSIISTHTLDGGNLISRASSKNDPLNSNQKNETKSEPDQGVTRSGSTPLEVDSETSPRTAYSRQRVENILLLLCCEDALHLYSMKSLKEGDINPIRKMNLLKPCCWTATFKKDDKECGLIVLYHTGVVEIRSLSDLEVVGESSLMSILKWNYKTNMEKTMCSSDTAQIILVNGCEFASVSLLPCENIFRIPESLPILHDKVLAAAAEATVSLSPSQKKTQVSPSGILGGFIKGLQAGKGEQNVDLPEVCNNNLAHLEIIFSSPPFLKPSLDITDNQKVLELNIDDIHIDEPLVVLPSSEMSKKDTKDKGTERDRLFEGTTSDSKPRLRTAEEIKAKYRKEDASAAAARARDKLAERGEKLERLSLQTEELESGAQDFASMAHELAKQMEKRKWWNI